ncbi:uncharacterized protein K444DRAFT_614743 [Hyaloscypha bicolor E]|uniref:Uncharacterized protein n=1 Tax=Hyaloscypha bicolor E TaxID=1095630 RepID=A0A2J6T454_9HELO|nr:uncharacterized protein K444DRAFT_614743 [Hyaloscypha bicolor E]PMD57797.1 hypothetical protein K444DRAFT_614743 [Hyaloscypha bicolor E]
MFPLTIVLSPVPSSVLSSSLLFPSRISISGCPSIAQWLQTFLMRVCDASLQDPLAPPGLGTRCRKPHSANDTAGQPEQ